MASRKPKYTLFGEPNAQSVAELNEMFVELYALNDLGHNILSATHLDTRIDPEQTTLLRGDILVAQRMPAGADVIRLQRFAIGDAATVLKTTDGIDLIYGKVVLTAGATQEVTGTLPILNGGTGNTAYTAGSIIFAGAGTPPTVLTEDNTNLFWDDTNNLLGINTNTPTYSLEMGGGGLLWAGAGSASGGTTTINIVGGISAADTTITVASTTGFPAHGIVQIEGEFITYTGKTSTTLTGATRGRFGSTAATHADGTTVRQVLIISGRDSTAANSIIVTANGNLYIGIGNNVFEIPSGSAVADFKVTRFSVGGTWGAVYGNGTVNAFYGITGSTCYFGAASNHPIEFRVANAAVAYLTGGLLFQLGGTTSSFPALKRSSAEMQVRLADDSAFASLQCNALTINAQTGNVAGTTYTPVRSAEANLDANATMFEAQYDRTGNTVTVSGRFTADPTAPATATSFEMTLPIASNIGAVEDLAGVAFCGAIAGQGAQISGSVANNTAVVSWVSGDVTSQSWSFIFQYAVI